MSAITSLKKLAISCLLTATALAATSVNAASCRNGEGKAKIKLDQTVLSTLKPSAKKTSTGPLLPTANADGSRYIYVNEYFDDSEFLYPTGTCTATPANSLWLCNSTPTNHPGLAPDKQPYKLPVVCSVPPYQAGNVVTTWNPTTGGDIGLAGAFKIRSDFQNPTLSIRWGKLSLSKNATNGKWYLMDNLGGGSIFEVVNIKQEVEGNELELKGNLKFGDSAWGTFLSSGLLQMDAAAKDKIVGSIQLELE